MEVPTPICFSMDRIERPFDLASDFSSVARRRVSSVYRSATMTSIQRQTTDLRDSAPKLRCSCSTTVRSHLPRPLGNGFLKREGFPHLPIQPPQPRSRKHGVVAEDHVDSSV